MKLTPDVVILVALRSNVRVRNFEWLNRNSPEHGKQERKPSFPEGFEIKKNKRLQVKKIENKEDYIDLFLDADPSIEMINLYLNKSDVYALAKDNEVICIGVILPIDIKTVELKNIVTKKEFRGKGYAKMLLKSLFNNYKQKYDKMIVGTTQNNIPFYVKQGFDHFEKVVENFFV